MLQPLLSLHLQPSIPHLPGSSGESSTLLHCAQVLGEMKCDTAASRLLALKVKREGKLEGFVFKKKTPNKKKERKQKKSKKEIPEDFHRKQKKTKN